MAQAPSYYMLGSRVLRTPLLHAELYIFTRVYVYCDAQSKSYVASQSAPAISSWADLYADASPEHIFSELFQFRWNYEQGFKSIIYLLFVETSADVFGSAG